MSSFLGVVVFVVVVMMILVVVLIFVKGQVESVECDLKSLLGLVMGFA